MSAVTDDAARLAQSLVRNCGYAVFPCSDDKRPTLKEWPQRADAIAVLWGRHPGPLIGIATGEISGIDVLDVDPKHDAARLWRQSNHRRLLPTRCYVTRSDGVHLYFRHRDGIRNTQGKLCPGIDTRGDGGYVISWWAAGLD